MHSISPYLLRCNIDKDKNIALNKIGKNNDDLYNLLKQFIDDHSNEYTKVEGTKQTFKFESIQYDNKYREIYGWFSVGHYGMKTDIIDIDSGDVEYKKKQKNAEIIKYYIHFLIPYNCNEAIVFMHQHRNLGVKHLFYTIFSPFFRKRTEATIKINPLPDKKAMDKWLNAPVQAIRVTKFTGAKDITDQLFDGHYEQELVIKSSRNKILGQLKEYIKPHSSKFEAIEVASEYGSQVKALVKMNGKERTFTIGANAFCKIQLDDNVKQKNGFPELESMYLWVKDVMIEYVRAIYPSCPDIYNGKYDEC